MEDRASTLSTRYDASQVEARWYAQWEEAELFKPDPDPGKQPYTIAIPPPNVTGSLHMGHALCYGLQDVCGRYQRLRGKSVLILPGQDHAGIATQSVVAKKLRKEGIDPVALGRERFVQKVWEWREESGGAILRQLRLLGCAFDWSRNRFTLDEQYARAVVTAFIDWFERGLIYKGNRVVNWDPALQTSVSDIETERRTVRGKLYHIRYPFAHGPGEVVIATTRPETMLADVAVAVHPSDARYKGKIGQTLILPLMNREIPLIEDIYPDPEFGTGAVKITPAHDPNDFEVGLRHNLDMPVVLDGKGRVNALGGPYAGLDRLDARKRVVSDLEEQGFLVKVEDHDINVLVSERSGEVIEPLLSLEWFAKQSDLAAPVVEAVRNGEFQFTPERYKQTFLDWMENVRDWNISRKLWWGHRVPVYYTEDQTPFAAHTLEEAQVKAGDRRIVGQDEDVLDTWFSSGLWPFATLGWPEQSAELSQRYPTDVLVTSKEIINLWVARMAMMGIDLVDEKPFRDVYIYATVQTEEGKRMSKSLGTGVDPTEAIAATGADAIRFALFEQTGMNQTIRYGPRKIEEARNFCNKIWNATRFVLMNLDPEASAELPPPDSLHTVDRWLLSRLRAAERAAREGYDGYDMQAAAQALHRFFWGEMCDWYIEISKPRLVEPADRKVPQAILLYSIRAFVTMLHPLMPFITEEIHAHLPIPDKPEFLMASAWPEIPEWLSDAQSEQEVERWLEITRQLRALRAELGLSPMKPVEAAYFEGDLRGGEVVVASQAWVRDLRPGKPQETSIGSTVAGVDLHLPTAGLIDEQKELQRLHNEREKLEAERAKLTAQLQNPHFVERANPSVVEKLRSNLLELDDKLTRIQSRERLFQ